MRWRILAFCLLTACGPVAQPESDKTVAAFEVSLPTESVRTEFFKILRPITRAFGMDIQVVDQAGLDRMNEISPPSEKMTINAAIWRDANDDEIVAWIEDFPGHTGRAWICFARGKDAQRNRRFRDQAMQAIRRRWPNTLSLPIMPNGQIPLAEDLTRTTYGYIVKPLDALRYAKRRNR